MKEDIRRVFAWGGYSFGITLPKKWITENNIKRVQIENCGDVLTIKPKR